MNKMKEIKQQMIQEKKKKRMMEERRKAELQRQLARRREEQGRVNLYFIWFPVHPELHTQQFSSNSNLCTRKIVSSINFS